MKYLVKTITLRNGKRKYIRGKTQEELDKKVNAIKMELGLGIDVSDTTLVRDYADQWYRTTRAPYVKPNTVAANLAVLENHIYPYIGNMQIRAVKPAHIREIMFRCSSLGRESQTRILNLMKGIFATAVDDNIIIRSPVPTQMKASGKTAEETKPLTPQQEKDLLQAAKGHISYPFVFTMLHTGMRRGEVTALMWSDIDYDAEVIHIRRHVVTSYQGKASVEPGAKTSAGVRDIPMPKALMEFLKDWQQSSRSVYVFPNSKGTVYSSSAFGVLWETLNKRAGFHTHPHQLRHTYATKLFEAGLDLKQVQYIMGHENMNVTMNIYTHYREESRRCNTIQQVQAAFA